MQSVEGIEEDEVRVEVWHWSTGEEADGGLRLYS